MNKKTVFLILIFISILLISLYIYKTDKSRDKIVNSSNYGHKCVTIDDTVGVIDREGVCVKIKKQNSDNLKNKEGINE